MARIDTMQTSEAEYTCAVGTGAKVKGACNEGESIYGLSAHLLTRLQPATKLAAERLKRCALSVRINTYSLRGYRFLIHEAD